MRRIVIAIFLSFLFPIPIWGQKQVIISPDNETAISVNISFEQTIALAQELVKKGNTADAKVILMAFPFPDPELEKERLFLLGQCYMQEKQYSEAIKVFRFLLDRDPSLSRIRLELALAYMGDKSWYRADYHLRLVASDKELPDDVKKGISGLLYAVRKNKNWNAWVNFGVAPDNNANGAVGGQECISTIFGILCRQLPEPEKVMGYNLGFGGNYEFKLSEQWRLKNDFALFGNFYDKSKYDSLYLMASSGPKYVYSKGDVWAALTYSKRYLSHRPFSDSIGGRIETNYDFSNRFSGGLSLSHFQNFYSGLGEILNGHTNGISGRLFYALTPSIFSTFRTGIEKEYTKEEMYSSIRYNSAVGFGAELPWGFRAYIEPSLIFIKYDSPRTIIKDMWFEEIREQNIINRYAISLSNNNIEFYDFVPNFTYSYTNQSSNVPNRDYGKHTIALTLQRRF
jgi:tetratricopeptide (TPR) repeat protein